MKSLLIAALFALASIGTADAAVRYFVDDTTDILKTLVTDDTLTAPAGETAVTKTVIETACGCSVYLGGTWDGTTYTAPAGITVAIDSTTDIGAVQEACSEMLDVFETALDYIHGNRFAWPEDARAKAETGISWQIINSARVALNATRTHARRQKFCEESASWPDGTNGNVREYVDAIVDNGSTPTKDWSWVMPETDPYTRTNTVDAAQGFNNATNVENAPGTDKLIGRGWLADIP